jgi:hypothetical protein
MVSRTTILAHTHRRLPATTAARASTLGISIARTTGTLLTAVPVIGTTTISTSTSNPNNNIGKAWDLGIVEYAPGKFSLPRAGRGFAALQTGDKFSTTIDNPNTGNFDYKGYSFQLVSATGTDANAMGTDGNICYHASNCTPGIVPKPKNRLSLFSVNAGAGNQWRLSDGAGSILTGLLTSTTAATGVIIDVTMTGPDSYSLSMTAVGGGLLYQHNGPLANAGLPTNWAFYQNFNGVATGNNLGPTDFYISQMSTTLVPEPTSFGMLVLGAGTLLGFGTARRRWND